ncbi:uncharacterized protein BYT42DRAFT_472334, partial [Radiomyces spectabilis]|uniref:uncharacterized protein n=1 Tax=Radiomyces spectabilis TaxID=64574 RepID=UPI00221F6745
PPAYDDPIHPWNDKLPAHWTSWKVEPREEEGQEKLPPYECTVYKMGFVKLKRELKRPGVLSGHRSWTQVYLKLWGTMIQIYKKAPQSDGHKPLWSFSMENMQITVPSDYKKYRHVIRLQVPDGPRFLVRTTNATDQNLWIEHLQASANVSSDIDSRSMPQFITLSRHRR